MRRHGQGTFFYANGSRYEGQWVRGAKEGHGLFTFEDGSVYEGPFLKDRMADGKLSPAFSPGRPGPGPSHQPQRPSTNVPRPTP